MAHAQFSLAEGSPAVVGSFGEVNDLREAAAAEVRASCDLVEIRLDLILAGAGGVESSLWQHLHDIPLLFTARRMEEGGALALSATERANLLRSVLDHAAFIDIEFASIGEMGDLLKDLEVHGIPWIASFHDFDKLPANSTLARAADSAQAAGAYAFKAAATLTHPDDIPRLAEFQMAEHRLPVATMGMGRLAPVSRLLCAQCGSALNYGYLGKTPTAPGQWEAALLKQAIARLTQYRH